MRFLLASLLFIHVRCLWGCNNVEVGFKGIFCSTLGQLILIYYCVLFCSHNDNILLKNVKKLELHVYNQIWRIYFFIAWILLKLFFLSSDPSNVFAVFFKNLIQIKNNYLSFRHVLLFFIRKFLFLFLNMSQHQTIIFNFN